jgi:5-hydroxyisourate hydrolase-like protein (transthyretin family)
MNPISFQSVYQTITAAGEFKLGQRAVTPDGREWTFAKAQTAVAVALVAVPDAVASSDLYSSSTDSQGRIVYLTRAANSLTVGQYEDAIGVVDDGTGVGQTFKIRTNNATTFTLYPETALGTALAVADSDLTYISMSYLDPAAITDKVQMAQGIAQVSFAAADYGWILTNGTGRVKAGEALVVGKSFVTGDDTVGQVVKGTTAKGPFDEQSLGYAIVANAAADQGALVMVVIR